MVSVGAGATSNGNVSSLAFVARVLALISRMIVVQNGEREREREREGALVLFSFVFRTDCSCFCGLCSL